ncbi:metallo-phosphoesterase [Baekduia alba]|uniref:metallophosphoesterase family protein n=1 Tax=Baekduia alba TaxID=2997333 RepID=UPI002341CAF5|nr:metallophosphoesterase [Baekduia alba]WCB94257.1 metallo-phosphoesterase [Baekduia alba]
MSDTPPPVRIAAAGDMHCQPSRAAEARAAFGALNDNIDLLLLAGDLTTHGQPEQAEVLADAVRDLDVPIYAVWGNHDLHCDDVDGIRPILQDAGVTILEREAATVCVGPTEIGIVGLKGFVGGFPGSHLPDFGEPLLRAVYAETTKDVEALDEGLKQIAHCPFRIVLLHYAPTIETLRGEPATIWTMLGNDRLAAPIAQHEPDMVLHGHAHAGTFEGHIDDVPVYNVSVPVLGKDFWVFELSGLERATAPLH